MEVIAVLMLGVEVGDYVMIGDDIKIRVVKTGSVFRIGVDAPKHMRVLRSKPFENNTGVTDTPYPESEYGKRRTRK
jgi:carbon storage regulator